MGQDIGEGDEIPYWYYIWFPIIIFIRMVQSIFSLGQSLFGVLLNDESAWCRVYCFAWMLFEVFISFCFELSDLFRWLVWMSLIIKLIMLEQYVGLGYVTIFVSSL